MEELTSTTKQIRIDAKDEDDNSAFLRKMNVAEITARSSESIITREECRSFDPPDQKRKKVVAQTDTWIQAANTHRTQESQQKLLSECLTSEYPGEHAQILLSHLKTKRAGYKSQDLAKGLYDETRFVDIDHIVNLLVDSGLTCYYCRKWATIFYEFVRDPRQWSLERLSNEQGHNCGNVVIACLECNMRRRTMYPERYLVTKQLRVNKLQ